MPTLAEILASKSRAKPVTQNAYIEIEIKTEEEKEQKSTSFNSLSSFSSLPPSPIHSVLAFTFLINNPHNHQDYLSLLSYFNIPYTPWITKAKEEEPPALLAFLVAQYYNKTYPVRHSFERAAHVLTGVGRILNNEELELLAKIMERKVSK